MHAIDRDFHELHTYMERSRSRGTPKKHRLQIEGMASLIMTRATVFELIRSTKRTDHSKGSIRVDFQADLAVHVV